MGGGFIPNPAVIQQRRPQPRAPYWDGPTPEQLPTTDWNRIYPVEPCDLVKIGDLTLPGVSFPRGMQQLAVDDKKPKGANGTVITVTGYQPGPFEIVETLENPWQWAVFQDVLRELWLKPKAQLAVVSARSKTGGKVGIGGQRVPTATLAFDIYHPFLDAYEIRSVLIQGVSLPEESGEKGRRQVKWKVIEFKRPDGKSATHTPKSSAPKRPPLVPSRQPQQPELNAVPDPPSKTATGPRGERPRLTGGGE